MSDCAPDQREVHRDAARDARTLKTCRQFFPLSFNRLSNISMISTKLSLTGDEARRAGTTAAKGDVLVI